MGHYRGVLKLLVANRCEPFVHLPLQLLELQVC